MHNIMHIFTFMGANIMRLDDTYSFQAISRTVQTVIPALIRVRFKLWLGLFNNNNNDHKIQMIFYCWEI